MKPAFIITMFDEHDIVSASIGNIKESFPTCLVIVVHSFNGTDFDTKGDQNTHYLKLPNLAGTCTRSTLPSQAICRNLSKGFTHLYDLDVEYDLVVSLTGDTLITDATSFIRRFDELRQSNKVAAVSQAVGQRFHASTDDPDVGISGGRLQTDETTDFACCIFMLDGSVAKKWLAFADIGITNRFTSEQCLGDELNRVIKAFGGGGFQSNVLRLNHTAPYNAYSYSDGIVYHARTSGRPGR